MKKLIPILLVALLLAVGLSLPAAGPADAVAPIVTVTKSVSPTTATVGDLVTYTVEVANEGSLTVYVTEVCDDRWSACIVLPSDTLSPGAAIMVEYSYQVTQGDVGVLTNCFTVTYNDEAGTVYTEMDCTDLIVEPLDSDIDIDIKPGSFPNSINVKSKGVLPVAILGTEDFDVMEVDPATVALTYPLFAGVSPEVSPLRWNWEDVNEDGFVDFVFKFDTQELMILTMTHEPDGAEMMLQLIGNLMDGSPIEGYDTVRIINK